MTRRPSRSPTAVERLLEQQRQYQDWLDRLDQEAKGAAPSHVAERVRADYAARLEEVNSELREHEDTLRQSLADVKVRLEGLQKQHVERTDELAEARLRRQVGEYDEERFEEVSVRCKAQLAELTKAITAADKDIERYEEILRQIEGEAEEEAEVIEELTPAEEPEEKAVEARAAAPAPEGDARGGKSKRQAPAEDVDELAFLRSITAEEAEPAEPAPPREPASRRASAPAMPLPAAAAEPAPAAPPEPVEEAAPAPPPPPPAPPAPAPPPKARRGGGAEPPREAEEGAPEGRTLVCTECGTKNLPTEWYCEKCGAELSAF